MHFQLVEKNKQSKQSVWSGVWIFAILAALLSLLDNFQYIYTAIPAVAIVVGAGFMPKKWQKRMAFIILGICAVWFVFRFKYVCNGIGILANRLFKLSEEAQNYYYVYFKVFGKSPVESLFFVSLILGAISVLLGSIVNMVMTLLIAIVIAYFCVAPNIIWLSVLIVAAFSNALPKKGRWLPAILVTVVVAITAVSMQIVAPEPNEDITYFAENFWDIVIPSTSKPIQKPTPIITPETQINPDKPKPPEQQNPQEEIPPVQKPQEEDPPDLEENPGIVGVSPIPQMPRPDESGVGKIKTGINWQFITRLAAALVIIGLVMAVWLAYAAKKRKQNRAAIYASNNAEAIRGMFRYAKKWRKLNVFPSKVRQEVEDLWLESVFSEHEMTDAQRDTMLSFVRYSAADAWNTLGTWERLAVYLYYAL